MDANGIFAVSDVSAWIGVAGITTISIIPLVGAILAVAALLFSIFGGGCGAACIDAAKVEQVFEAAADNLYLLARAGMIDPAHAAIGELHFEQQGHVALDRLKSTPGFNGLLNLYKVPCWPCCDRQGSPRVRRR